MRSFSRSSVVLLSFFAVGVAQACGSFTTAYRFDLAGQVVGVISPADGAAREAVRNTYDSEGRIVKIERGVLTACPSEDVLPANWPNFDVRYVVDKAYDGMGRLLSERRSGPTLTQYSYDSVGRLECTAVRMNPAVYGSIATLSACQLSTQGSQGPDRITRLFYDVADRVVTEQRAHGTGIQQNYATYGYTPNGRQDWVDDANGNRTDYTYDGFDRLSSMNFPQATVGAHAASSSDYEAYGYDNNSNLTSKRLRSGETITYGFDALNRLETKILAGTGSFSYTYDNFGLNETAQISGGAGISNTYDGFGRLTEATSSSSAGSLILSYGYDEDGNRTRVTWPDSTYVQYTYDGRNRMKQVRENNAVAGPGLLADYSYDVFGRRTYIVRGNGTTTTHDYDPAWRLSSLSQDLASTSQDLNLGFSYNSASQVAGRTVSNDAYSYFSMIQSKSYSRDGRNRYTAVGGMSYGYDGRGNLTSDGSRTFNYDLENHLLSVTGGANPVSLNYDPNGRLLTSTSGGVSTRYLYDGDKLVAEYNGSTLVRRYVHGAGVDEPLVWYEGAGLTDRRWLHTDHQGSVVANSNGTGVGTVYAYSAYGEPAYGNWGGSRFRYTGQIMLPEAKLYHYKARVYDPVLGRFLQTDPVGYKDDLNFYAYVGNDPLNHTDPTGLKCEGTGDNSRCVIDQVNIGTAKDPNWVGRSDAVKSGRVTEKQLSRLEGNITKAYVAAQALGNNKITVPGDAKVGTKDTQVSGNRLVMAMQDTVLRVDNRHQTDSNGVENPNVWASALPSGITFWKSGLSPTRYDVSAVQQHSAIHESLHMIPQLQGWGATEAARKAHQEPFKTAVEQLLGPAPW